MKNHYRSSIRVQIAVSSIVSLCLASCTSTLIVYGGFRLFHRGELSIGLAHVVMLLITFMTILVGGCIMLIISKRITRPIVRVSQGVAKISEGSFQMIAESKRTDEIGQLARNYNRMVAELQSMEYMNKEFMHNVSHELKTPIAAISGFAEGLLDGRLSKEQERDYLNCLYEETIRLSHLCENMLRLTKVESQGIIMNQQTYRLDEQLRKCIILIHEKWEEKEIEFDLDLLESNITADYELMQQVWINLIDNAAKFSNQGGMIYIDMKLDSSNSKIEISIADHGIGMAIDKLPKIFDRFYQCEESHSKVGYGLGLAIVKRIVELCEGEIICESTQGEGTVFRVVLPKE